MNNELEKRLETLFAEHRHESYQCNLFAAFGLPDIFVGKHVLRPDKSYVSKYLTTWLIENTNLFAGRNVLEIGCGSGVQSITMAWFGAQFVVSTDISIWACASCKENAERLFLKDKLSIRQGDLFAPIESHEKFDLILFNHPSLKVAQNRMILLKLPYLIIEN